MERVSSSSSWPWGYYCSESTGTAAKDMIEQAKEELQILEAQHPHRFNYLKLELQSFISNLEASQDLFFWPSEVPHMNPTSDVASSVLTQGSSAGKKRKKVGSGNGPVMEKGNENVELPKLKVRKISCIDGSGGDGCSKRREGIDVILERARSCLQKIHQWKISFSRVYN